jgi:23S rRNA pseudouridine955/2504/2580 synthase
LNPPEKTARPAVRHATVGADEAGQRLDNFLAAALKGVPKGHLYRLIRSGQVRVNSGRVAPSYRIQAGDTVRVPPVATAAAAPPPERAGLDWLAARVIHEDERLMVVDKPAGLAVHGGSGVSLGLIEALRVLRPELKSLELVHRLDRATSGCVMIAKRRSALRTLHALLREGRVEKRYMALVKGRWPAVLTKIDAPLLARKDAGEARVTVSRSGKSAVSSFRVLEAFGSTATYVEVRIETGRTHQIRVHAAHAGHPLAGDERYGDVQFNEAMARLGLKRMFLHAASLAFAWPDDAGGTFAASSPLPEELHDVLRRLRADVKRAGPRPRS